MLKALLDHLLRFERRLAPAHKEVIILCLDAALVPFCFLLSTLLAYGSLWPQAELARLAILFPLLAILGVLASLAMGLPRIKLKSFTSFSSNGLLSFVLVIALATALLTLLPGLSFPVSGTIVFAMALLFATSCARLATLRIQLWVLATQSPIERVLIYGAGQTGQQFASALQSHEAISVIAFIDDNPALHVRRLMGRKIYPSTQIEQLVQQYQITRVLLAMPSLSGPKLTQISRSLQALGLGVQALPSFAQLVGIEKLIQHLTPVPPIRFLGRNPLDDDLQTGPTSYTGSVVMISGAGGSVGSELCRQILMHQPAKLVLYEVSELALYQIERDLREASHKGVEIIPVLGSVADTRLTRAVLSQHKVDTVFHAAAYKHVPLVESNPVAGITNNVFGTRVLADACAELGVQRFILISTDKAVRPSNVMGASKRLAELVVQDRSKRSHSTHFAIVRFGNVLGSSGSVIPLFREQIARGGPVTLTHEDVTRYFMTIAEAAKLLLMTGTFLADGPLPGRANRGISNAAADVFVLDMGEPVRIRQLAEQMIQGAGCTVRDASNPNGDIEIKIIGLRPGEKLHEELLIGQSLLRTPHPKIIRASEESLSELEMAHAMRELAGFVATGDVDAIRNYTMRLVHPPNSPLQGKAASVAT